MSDEPEEILKLNADEDDLLEFVDEGVFLCTSVLLPLLCVCVLCVCGVCVCCVCVSCVCLSCRVCVLSPLTPIPSVTLGIFLCHRCAGAHRVGLSVQISRIRSVQLDIWYA